MDPGTKLVRIMRNQKHSSDFPPPSSQLVVSNINAGPRTDRCRSGICHAKTYAKTYAKAHVTFSDVDQLYLFCSRTALAFMRTRRLPIPHLPPTHSIFVSLQSQECQCANVPLYIIQHCCEEGEKRRAMCLSSMFHLESCLLFPASLICRSHLS